MQQQFQYLNKEQGRGWHTICLDIVITIQVQYMEKEVCMLNFVKMVLFGIGLVIGIVLVRQLVSGSDTADSGGSLLDRIRVNEAA